MEGLGDLADGSVCENGVEIAWFNVGDARAETRASAAE